MIRRKNAVRAATRLSSLYLTPDGGIWLAMESPLIQDGEIPSPTAGAIARLTRLNSDGTVAAQYAYAIDRITRAEPGKQSDNGISEMLALDDGRLLILERSGLQDVGTRYNFDCRLYLVDLDGATDVSTMDSLNDQTFTPASKTLLLDLNTLLGSNAGNLESMAWATRGLNPRGRLVLFTDDNFDAGRPTQMVVLRVGR